MDKLFHVFISSTYADLQDERRRVSEGVSKAGYVPEGMEIFPASSQKQFEFIKRVINRCDYYVLILAGRYGSLATEEIGFTELEYEYAVERGLPTLAFLHANPEKIEAGKAESDPARAHKLIAFRKKVEQKSLVDFWSAPDQLATKVVAALAQEVSSNPGIGWIRGDRAASADLLAEINKLRKQNDDLRIALSSTKPTVEVSDMAEFDDVFLVNYKYTPSSGYIERNAALKLTWREILKIVGPNFRSPSNTVGVDSGLKQYMRDVLRQDYHHTSLSMTDKETILNQMELLGFMKSAVYGLKDGGQALFYQLTPNGVAEVLRLNAIQKTKPTDQKALPA